MKRKRIVSEIVAVLLTTLIVISVGSIILVYLRSTSQAGFQSYFNEIEKANAIANEAIFEVIYCSYNATSNLLEIYLNVGPGMTFLSSIYLNDILLTDGNHLIVLNGIPVNWTPQNSYLLKEKAINYLVVYNVTLLNNTSAILKLVTSANTNMISSCSLVS